MRLLAIIYLPVLLAGIIFMNATTIRAVEADRNRSNSQAIQIFNSQFTGYAGVQSAVAIKALMTNAMLNNQSEFAHFQVNILAYIDGETYTTPEEVQANVHAQMNYRVTLEYSYEDYIDTIIIEETTDRR